jgi:hydroxypyruvate isomerase
VIDRVREEHGAENLRLLADFYHMHVNGDDITAALTEYANQIGHVQIADAPGRGEPGTGEIPIRTYLEQLAALGYAGYVGLEYKATKPDTFEWLPSAERAATLQPQAETRI